MPRVTGKKAVKRNHGLHYMQAEGKKLIRTKKRRGITMKNPERKSRWKAQTVAIQ